MSVLHVIAIILTAAEVIKPASSGRLTQVPSHEAQNEQILREKIPKERIAVPPNVHKSDAYSKFLSFAFNIPLQQRARSFDPNVVAKNLYPTITQSQFGTFSKATTQNGPGDGRGGELHEFRYNKRKPFELLGKPLSVVRPLGTEKSSNDRYINLDGKSPNGSFGPYESYRGNQVMQADNVPNLSSPSYENGKVTGNDKVTGPMPVLKEVSATGGEDLLVTDIVEIGKPLMLNLGRKGSGNKQHAKQDKGKGNLRAGGNTLVANSYKANKTSHANNNQYQTNLLRRPYPDHRLEDHVSYKAAFAHKGTYNQPSKGRLFSILESVHNSKTAPHIQDTKVFTKGQEQAERVFTASKNNKEGPVTVSKQNLRSNHSSEDDNKQGNSQWLVEQNQVSQDGLENEKGETEEEIGGYGTEEIENHFYHNNGSAGINDAELLKQGISLQRPPFRSRQQNQNTVVAIHGSEHGPEEGEGFQRTENRTEDVTSHHDSERYDYSQESPLFSQEQSSWPKGQQRDDSNLEQDQDEYAEGNQLEETPAAPASNERYMPVDEFGSPIYGNETDDYFQREALVAHNRYRVIHRAPPLKLDPQLSLEAKRFAKQLAKRGTTRHEIPKMMMMEMEGENVARGCSEWGGLTASGAVHRWYSQVCNYDWNKRTMQPKAKNFMQLIWKGASHMGIGRALGTRLGFPCTFIVARYRPGKINEFSMDSNIDKGLFLPSYCNDDGDDMMTSEGYPSSFPSQRTPPNMAKQGDYHGSVQQSSFQNTVEPAVTYEPFTYWDRNIDENDAQGYRFLNEQPDRQARDRFLPHVSYVGKSQDGVQMIVEDDSVKRDYEPSN